MSLAVLSELEWARASEFDVLDLWQALSSTDREDLWGAPGHLWDVYFLPSGNRRSRDPS